MISGRVSLENNLPYARVGLVVHGNTIYLEFVLDTGFSGDLKIDGQTAAELGMDIAPSGARFINANGERIFVAVVYGFAEMESRRAPIKILVGNGVPLAGSGLFSVFGYTVVVNYKNKTAYLE